MNIFHKILIFLNFLLAIATIVLGYFLFDQREIFKQRMAGLEQSADKMATALKWGEYGVHGDRDQPERFGSWPLERQDDKKKMMRDIQDYQRLSFGLKEMEAVAKDRVRTMINNKEQWDVMDQRLADTNNVLAATIVERDDWTRKFEDESDAHDATKGELQDALSKIQTLEGQILGLQSEVTMRDEEIAKRDQQIGKLEVELDQEKAEALSLAEQLRACREDGETVSDDIIAKVVMHEPTWNFVVIDAGRESNVKESSEALVHRGDKLVGKVKISRVEENVCIGQILRDWTPPGESIRPSDGIIF